MNLRSITLLFATGILLLISPAIFAQSSYSGNVLDATDKRYMEGVEVSVVAKDQTTTTNSRGYFNLQASLGDTLIFRFPGFIEQKIRLTEDRFLLVQIQDRARLLPTFEVRGEPYAFRFKDGKLILIDPNEKTEPSKKGEVSVGTGTSMGGGLTIYGPISYFSKRARQEREYQKKQEILSRRQGYLAVVDSDSVRTILMNDHQINRNTWDKIIVRFNEANIEHQFLDWSKEKVYARLSEFIRQEKDWVN